jgi:hypothetical protein
MKPTKQTILAVFTDRHGAIKKEMLIDWLDASSVRNFAKESNAHLRTIGNTVTTICHAITINGKAQPYITDIHAS